MADRFAADAVLLLHLAFIAFGVFGALLAVRWSWIPAIQLPTAAWGIFVEVTGHACPLTDLENHFRAEAGLAGYSESFTEHYLLPLIYPDGLTREIQWLLAGMVLAVNGTIYLWLIRRRRMRTGRR